VGIAHQKHQHALKEFARFAWHAISKRAGVMTPTRPLGTSCQPALLALAFAAATSIGAGCAGGPPTGSLSAAIGSCAAVSSTNFEYESDACKRKKNPTNTERSVSCPIVSTNGDGFAPSSDPMQIDDTALKGIVPDTLKVTAILIRRVDGQPVYRYLSNGTHDDRFEPWSSTKFMAVAGGGAAMRKKSQGAVGLTASANGTPLGDLVTVIASYREDRYTSNGLGRYFLNIAGRAAEQSLIHTWLGRPSTESYGGNYGEPAPTDLGYTFEEANGATVSIAPDDQTGIVNNLSTLTMAEFMKRLAVWDDAATRLPGLAEADVATIFYGPANSIWWPGEPGGLSADFTVFLQSALDMNQVEAQSQGRWRTFVKLGAGDNDWVQNSYACLPVLDAEGHPAPDEGAEFALSVRYQGGSLPRVEADQVLGAIYKNLVQKGILPRAEGTPKGNPGADGGGASPDAGMDGDGGVGPGSPRGCSFAASGASRPIGWTLPALLFAFVCRRRRRGGRAGCFR
jgi:hypothetical protein